MTDYVSGYGAKLEFDIGTPSTPNFQDVANICTNYDDAINAMVDTFHTLGYTVSISRKLATDPEWTLTLKGAQKRSYRYCI